MSTYEYTSGMKLEPTDAERFGGPDSCANHGHFYDDGYCEFCGIHEDEA